MSKKVLAIFILAIPFLFFSCNKDNDGRQFGIFKVLDDDQTIEMQGEIGSSSLNDFNELVEAFPNVNKINIIDCGGSTDDDVNLQLSAAVHQKGMAIHIADNGEIASGGTDFFLAGTTRTKGTNTRIGVHSWSDGSNEATDFPVGDPNHTPYINYYVSVGFTQQEAEDFYYFTINAAPANSMHWMTDNEIALYGILTP